MKRFYDRVTTLGDETGWRLLLDDKPVRTPKRAVLLLPHQNLAEAVADEWRAQGDKLILRDMRLTGLANAAIDRVAPAMPDFVAALVDQARDDLLLYRVPHPRELAARQKATWDPLLAWAARHHGLSFKVTSGIVPEFQPEDTAPRLHAILAAFDPFMLTAVHVLARASGSLILALALIAKAIDADAAWRAARLEESWWFDQWGDDDLAAMTSDEARAEFAAAVRFVHFLSPVKMQ